ncbi:Dam family site-specific DNA-(adenine-N6)-methyltransferase [Pectobacterium aroidearum]|uniref:DNA adenine methylase n=1 Tax=Pectobacterium aroidearum TaxID=1201031 RepID=UPI00211447FD|nr:Dam family site-specific DNA-(adenine-N6)-methyltransferase [Pectobacterium aroidearum]UUE36541.1 Dam family site-specific DNA-(adenine-N6)-methyltransferase [Pectobacterium aroidearum]UUE40917.1 Dam family site-specific DNA-(adenine-N6)-methyltransferase [Pectobacterium aroidearum]
MIRPFIKWAGGKSRVLPDLLPLLPKGDCLIEPFVGGASVFLNTDYRHYVLADINADLINMYSVAKNQTDDFLDAVLLVFKKGNSKEAYLEIRELFNWANRNDTRLSDSSSFKLIQAARFLYLNRHGYNGMCRYNKNGEFNIPHGKYKTQYLPFVEIKQFAEKANDTKALFVVADFRETLTSQAISKSSVIYCDPPYLPASDTANFTQYHHASFTPDHHRDLAALLLSVNLSRGVPVVISNSDTPATREIYQHYQFHEIAVQRSISANGITRGAAKEVIGVLNKVCE